MKKERLFTKYGTYNDVGNEISDKISKVITNIFKEYGQKYDYPDMAIIMYDAIGAIHSERRILQGIAVRKEEKVK